jgi:three-Cys-motif partner protein
MVSLEEYAGREQSYVKHVFLERYLEALVFKTASMYSHIVYVDGFAGPWQSADEEFGDTSFGIALSALRQAKEAWSRLGRRVKMTALLVEIEKEPYARLATLHPKYSDIEIKTYNAEFVSNLPVLLRDIPADAFAYFLIDPKGWRIPMLKLQRLLARQKSEVTFSFMFDFINRAASIDEPIVKQGLDELMPYGDWKAGLIEAEREKERPLTPDERKEILVGAFSESLRQIGGYKYVAETTILRPLKDRTLYCLCYATRHSAGIEAFRDCQVAALKTQAAARAAGKVTHKARSTGQFELFGSLHEMGRNEMEYFLEEEKKKAGEAILQISPKAPEHIYYNSLWASVLARHVVRLPDVNTLTANLRKSGELVFLDWEKGKRVPKDNYRLQRP